MFTQLELIKFEGEVLTGDGGIVRRIKVKGEGYTNPNDGSIVNGNDMICLFINNWHCASLINDLYSTWQHHRLNCALCLTVHLEGRCGDRLFDCRDVNFIVGQAEDKSIPLGVDRAMDKMQKGECCLLYLKPK